MWRRFFLGVTRIRGLLVFALLCGSLVVQGAKPIKIIFKQSSSRVDSTIAGNARKLAQLDSLLSVIAADTLVSVDSISVECTSSPDGNIEYNQRLSNQRALAFADYLKDTGQVPDSLIVLDSYTVPWSYLVPLVENHNIDNRRQLVAILESYPSSRVASRIKELDNGKTYKYMADNILSNLRCANVYVIYHTNLLPPIDEHIYYTNRILEPEYILGSGYLCECLPTTPNVELKPLFAIKTNLLFDALSLINVELEVPIGNRWSVAGELIFPWWTWDNKQLDSRRHRIQLLNGTLEGRYWFGNRAQKDILTGWFAGFYAGGGLYDFEYKKKGYQGEFLVASGLSGGYAHTINKSKTLRMEYSLGVGYLRTKYRYYEADCYYDNRWHPMKEREGMYTWIGPTRAKVSLSWLINYRKKY